MTTIYKICKLIKLEKFNTVVAHSPKGGLLGMNAAFLCFVNRRVYFRHCLIFETEVGFKKKILIYLEKFTAKLAVKVINVSKSLIVESNYYKLNRPKKNFMLGDGTCNGIDTEKFQPRQKEKSKFVLGYVGGLSVDKGIVALVNAWQFGKLNHNQENVLAKFEDNLKKIANNR